MTNALLRNRKLNRLKGYDYSQNGFYFVTICVHQQVNILGNIINGQMELNRFGNIVSDCWNDLPNHYANCVLHEFIVMPNHVHGIIEINNNGIKNKNDVDGFVGDGRSVVGDGLRPSPTTTIHGLSEMVRALKSFSSRRINEISGCKYKWQRSFYDHIIRDEQSFNRITTYIQNNPGKWMDDSLNQ